MVLVELIQIDSVTLLLRSVIFQGLVKLEAEHRKQMPYYKKPIIQLRATDESYWLNVVALTQQQHEQQLMSHQVQLD
jgi:hypothetical protein